MEPWRPGPRLRAATTLLALGAGVTAVVVGADLMLRPPAVAAGDAGTVPLVVSAPAVAEPAPADLTTAPADPGTAPVEPATEPEPPGHPAAAPADPVPDVVPAAQSYGQTPLALRSPDVGVHADVVPVSVTGSGALEVPADPAVIGWWSSGAAAGASQGSVVLVGHVDTHAGVGVMRSFLDAPVGTVVEVTGDQGGAVAYQVVARRAFSKSDGLPGDLFRAEGTPQLVLITCGGEFDARSGHYEDNVVLYAVPV